MEILERVNKSEFLSKVAQRSGAPLDTVDAVYRALTHELIATVSRGQVIVLKGFGKFHRQLHKGHKVRFGVNDVNDYPVLKFSASRTLNRQLGETEDTVSSGVTHENAHDIDTSETHTRPPALV